YSRPARRRWAIPPPSNGPSGASVTRCQVRRKRTGPLSWWIMHQTTAWRAGPRSSPDPVSKYADWKNRANKTNERKSMNNKFDELAKSLAQSVTRRGALRKFGVGLAGMALACFGLASKARAAHVRQQGYCQIHNTFSGHYYTGNCVDPGGC